MCKYVFFCLIKRQETQYETCGLTWWFFLRLEIERESHLVFTFRRAGGGASRKSLTVREGSAGDGMKGAPRFSSHKPPTHENTGQTHTGVRTTLR